MNQRQLCQSCEHSHNCDEIYKKLGKDKTPSVAPAVVTAFLLPLVVFIAALTFFERIFSELIGAGRICTAVSFAAAVGVTLTYLLSTKAIINKLKGVSKGH